MKKVCILSMQDVDNYGSVLQSYVLKGLLEEIGCKVSFVSPFSNENDINIEVSKNKKSIIKRIINKIVFLSKQKVMDDTYLKIQEFRNEFLTKANISEDSFDCCFIGSDEVYNCLQPGMGYKSCFFGKVPNCNKIATYACSCGYTEYDKLPVDIKSEIEKDIKNISNFSTRDKNTDDFLRKFGINDYERHLDPVLLGRFEEVESAKVNYDFENCCIVYAYGDRFKSPKEIAAIKKFCKENKVRPITVFGTQSWIKEHVPLAPFQLLKAISKAKFVITDTFHGTIFSYKFAKNFAVFVRDSNSNKLKSLAKTLGIEDRLVDDDIMLQDILAKGEFVRNQLFIDEQRERSKLYLSKVLNEDCL